MLVASIIVLQQPSAPPGGAQMPSVELSAELDRVLRDYERAWTDRDAKGLAVLFAPDGFVLRGGHPPVRGRAEIEKAYAGAGGPLHLRALAFKSEGTTGWIIGAYSGGAGQADSGKFVLALEREASGPWLIAADIDTTNQPRRP
jgi:ketosteroid isomerase-like protein